MKNIKKINNLVAFAIRGHSNFSTTFGWADPHELVLTGEVIPVSQALNIDAATAKYAPNTIGRTISSTEAGVYVHTDVHGGSINSWGWVLATGPKQAKRLLEQANNK